MATSHKSRPPRPPAPKLKHRSKSSKMAAGISIHFSPGSDSDEGSAEVVTSKNSQLSKTSSLDTAYAEISEILNAPTTRHHDVHHRHADRNVNKKTSHRQHVYKGSNPETETTFGGEIDEQDIYTCTPPSEESRDGSDHHKKSANDTDIDDSQTENKCSTEMTDDSGVHSIRNESETMSDPDMESAICENSEADVKTSLATDTGKDIVSAGINETGTDKDIVSACINETGTDKDIVSAGTNETDTDKDIVSAGINDTDTDKNIVSAGINDTDVYLHHTSKACDNSTVIQSNDTTSQHLSSREHSNSVTIVRSWQDGSVDPLTALSLESDDCDSQFMKSVPKSESVPVFCVSKEHSDSFKIVDDFYDAEPMEDFDGHPHVSQSLPSSPTHQIKKCDDTSASNLITGKVMSVPSSPTNMSKSGYVESLKKRLKKSGQSSDFKGLTFSSLTKTEESLEVIEDLPGLETNGTHVKQKILNKNQSANTDSMTADLPYGLPLVKILLFTMFTFSYLILPIPSFISGLLMGAFIMYGAMRCYNWLTEIPAPKEPIFLDNIDELPPLEIPLMKENKPKMSDNGNVLIYEGWMNELTSEYSMDTYHVSDTVSVLLTLQGTTLRLRRPKNNIPKHHVWFEPMPSPHFIHQRHFDISGAHVFLRPEGLVKKRVWSKKYPICVMFNSSPPEPNATGSLSDISRTNVAPEKKIEKSASLTGIGSGFEFVSAKKCEEILFLFARSCREKEEWFYRLQAASRSHPLLHSLDDFVMKMSTQESGGSKGNHSRQGSASSYTHKRQSSNESVNSLGKEMEDIVSTPEELIQRYVSYMGHIMPSSTKDSSGKVKGTLKRGKHIECDPSCLWVNAVISRAFFDFIRLGYWKDKVREKIQKKLSKIHVPYFIDELTLTDIDLGPELPTIRRASKPFLDDRGLWIDLDIAYGGGFKMRLETKVNLLKFKKTGPLKRETTRANPSSSINIREKGKSAVTDSDEEDSAESSSEDEQTEPPPDAPDGIAPVSSAAKGAGKKILKFIDTITDTKFFQQATEYKYIKRAMEGVSNTPLVLSVEVLNLAGTLAINMAPPPTDRLWYGFRTNPKLTLSAIPQVGGREVSMTRVVEWIENKLSVEFQKVFVIPNMDDFVIPVMKPGKWEESDSKDNLRP